MKEGNHEVRTVRVYDLFRGPRGGVFFFLREHRLLFSKKRSRDKEPTAEDILHYSGETPGSSGSEECWKDWE
jgi:hypothetical protein